MTILAETTGWVPIIENVLLVVHIVICLLLCLVVLMQRPKQEGLGAAFGGGMTDQAFGARTTDVLQKGTVYLGSLLFIITLALSILVGSKSRSESITADLNKSGAAAIEENGDAAAAAAAMLTGEEELTAEGVVDAIKDATEDATGEGEEGEESGSPETETETEKPETDDPEAGTPAPTEEPEAPEAPAESETPGQ